MAEDLIATLARIAARMGGWGILAAVVIVIVGAAALVFFPGLRRPLVWATLALAAAWKKMRQVPVPPPLTPEGNLPEGQGAPPIPVSPDGTIHLDQKPPPDNL